MTKFFLYFDSQDDAASVALELDLKLNTRSVVKTAKDGHRQRSITSGIDFSLGPMRSSHPWMVITSAQTPGSSPGVTPESYRALMESIAKQNRGEYEGWIKQ